MRDTTQIKREIESLRYEIRLAQREYTSEREMEMLYDDLEQLREELYKVQSHELILEKVR
jgi:hypothetical protein